MRVRAVVVGLLVAWPTVTEAQISSPCELTCGLLLGASATTAATGTLVAWGRATGGLETRLDGALVWGTAFVTSAGAGLALGGDGRRQERVAHAAGVGILVGAATGTLFAALTTETSAERWASVVIGAGAGALLGGVIGAITYDEDFPPTAATTTLFAIRLSF